MEFKIGKNKGFRVDIDTRSNLNYYHGTIVFLRFHGNDIQGKFERTFQIYADAPKKDWEHMVMIALSFLCVYEMGCYKPERVISPDRVAVLLSRRSRDVYLGAKNLVKKIQKEVLQNENKTL